MHQAALLLQPVLKQGGKCHAGKRQLQAKTCRELRQQPLCKVAVVGVGGRLGQHQPEQRATRVARPQQVNAWLLRRVGASVQNRAIFLCGQGRYSYHSRHSYCTRRWQPAPLR